MNPLPALSKSSLASNPAIRKTATTAQENDHITEEADTAKAVPVDQVTRSRGKLGVIGGKKIAYETQEIDNVETGRSEEPDETRTKASADSVDNNRIVAEAAECETASERSTRSPPHPYLELLHTSFLRYFLLLVQPILTPD